MVQRPFGRQSSIRATESPLRFVVRVLGFGLLLIYLNIYWIVASEHRVIGEVTIFSFFPTVLFTLFVLALVNHGIKRWFPRAALTQTELATLFVMMSIATAISGRDIARQLVPTTINGIWLATPENDWANLFHAYFPRWLTVFDRDVLRGYYAPGTEGFWQSETVEAWLPVFLAWSAFASLIFFVSLCINIVLRRQWTEHEKLNFPLTQLPIEMIGNTEGLFASRLTWIGFAVALSIEVLNGLHYLFPTIPSIPMKALELGQHMRERPWSAVGWFPARVYLFAVGVGYLMPIHLSFSLWVFFLGWKAEHVVFDAMGWPQLDTWWGEQRAGAWMAIGLFALWTSRHHIGRLLRGFVGRGGAASEGEPLYQFAFFGGVGAFVAMLVFWRAAGLPYWAAALYFGIYLVICIAISRMRAELGPPTHELHHMHPDRLMIMFVGSRRLGAKTLSLTTLLQWLAYTHRSQPTPHQMEGFKLGSLIGIRDRRLVLAMVFAIVAGSMLAIGMHIVLYYRYTFRQGFDAVEPFPQLASWLIFPREPNVHQMGHVGFGFGTAVLLSFMKRRFLWWPLYPVGYAVSYGWSMSGMWFSIFWGWLAKRIAFSTGGIGSYRRMLPLFLGLILGQFLAWSLWMLVGLVMGQRVYSLYP